MTYSFNPSPKDILLCRFPEDGKTPSAKARPVLVKAVGRGGVTVIYGTSRKTGVFDAKRDGEFVVEADRNNGLDTRTKFDCRKTATLPLTREWFQVPRGTPFGRTPKMGRLAGFLNSLAYAMA